MSLKNRLNPRNSWRSLWHAVLVAFLIKFLRERFFVHVDMHNSRGNMTGLLCPPEVPTTDMDYESTDESADEYAT